TAVEEERRRKPLQPEPAGENPFRVEDARVVEAVAPVERPRRAPRVLGVDPEDGDARVPADESGESWRLGDTASAPGPPDVDDDDPAGVVREAQPLAGDDVGSGERRRLQCGGGDQRGNELHREIVADGRLSPAISRSASPSG